MAESIATLLEDSRNFREECRSRREVLKRELLQSVAAVTKIMRSVEEPTATTLDRNS